MKNLKRILALAGVVLLVLLYLSTLVFALMKSPLSQDLFKVSVFCTIVIPILLYVYQLIYRVLNKKKPPATDKRY